MYLLIATVLTLASSDGPDHVDLCTYALGWFPARRDTEDFYLARATGDSVFVRDLYWAGGKLSTTPKSPLDRKISIFGQVAEVIQPGYDIDPRTKSGEKVVFVWWSYGAGCEILPGGRALGVDPGTVLFVDLDPLPRPSWIDGLKTYDVEGQFRGTSSLYAPQFVSNKAPIQPNTSQSPPMSAEEFMTMYRRLPVFGSSTRGAIQQFLVWTKDNPLLARKYPACAMAEVAEMNLVLASQRRSLCE
jgi:hypothetical protein